MPRAGAPGRTGRAAGGGASSPIHRADARHCLVAAHAVGQQALANFPREHGHVLRLVADDRVDNFAGGDLGFAASDHPRLDGPSVVVSAVVHEASAPTPDQHTELHASNYRTAQKKTGPLALCESERCQIFRTVAFNQFLLTVSKWGQ